MKKRLDLRLVEMGQASSRTKAQDLIKSGSVRVDGKIASSPSQNVDEQNQIEVLESELNRFVSRGGLKLEGALHHARIQVSGLDVLDVGISTGGFTDCLLKCGAKHVTGVDVGHEQLHPSLKSNPKLTNIEGINARELHLNPRVLQTKPEGGWPLIVIDVSFISLTLVLPALAAVLKSGGSILALVKPQFEVGPEGLGKGGIVKDPALYQQIESKIRQTAQELGLTTTDYFDSPIEGKDGNREFFALLQKKP